MLDDTGAAAIGALLAGDRRPRLPPLRPCAATLARGFVGVRPGSQIAPASMRRGGLLAARAALVAVARVVVVALAWVPPPCPRGPGAPLRASGSPLGGARSAVLVVALAGGAPPGRGGLTCPPPPLGWRNSLAMVLAAASPPAPWPPAPRWGAGESVG